MSLKKQFIASLIGLTMLFSCSKDNNGTTEATPTDAKKTIETTMDSFYNCLKNLNDGSFSKFLYDVAFEQVKTGKTRQVYVGGYWDNEKQQYISQYAQKEETTEWLTFLAEKYEENIGKFIKNKQYFNFQELKGVYTYNKNASRWEKTANSSKLEFYFPADSKIITNNAKLVIENYSDKEITFQNEKVRLPITISLFASVDNEKVFSLEVNNVDYEVTSNILMPIKANVTIFSNPFTTNIRLERKTPTVFDFAFNFSSPQGCSTTANAEITLQNSNFDSFSAFDKDVKKIQLTIGHNDLNIIANADIEGLFKSKKGNEKYSSEQINTYIKMEVFKGRNEKLADLNYVEDANGNFAPELIFSDGTKEKAEKYISDFDVKIEQIFKKFLDANKD
ncbi:MAG: hypothetical protein Q3983_03580 [Capnocytophaga sp.]|nr:hypothetical protein [Capnocytophaga sp.]